MADYKEPAPTRFGDFIKNIESHILRLTTLEIRTILGDYNLQMDDSIEPRPGTDFKVLRSKIDLIGGDMTTYISNDLIGDRYEWLREFHARKEQRGHELVNGNIKAIMSLIELYRNAKNTNSATGIQNSSISMIEESSTGTQF